ncbi:GNAT family N-acetyltransferase [Nocardioides alcanivorans]|uniref:GNAT family N-acetyltransferase n=1 Tax=Nocardioides alcanivorans TaxID=2897352 RepID=UPI001F3E236D|nr:GNAT family N-acetyltransferase [Nocardioides alcanivorans]
MTNETVRVLGPADFTQFVQLTDRDPVVNVFVEHRARLTSLEPRWLGGEVWGRFLGEELVAAMHIGANLVPIGCGAADIDAFVKHALWSRRSVATIVGPVGQVGPLWERLEPDWGPAREIRAHQPHLEIASTPLVEPDPLVVTTTRDQIDLVYPACVAMYTEEVGISPESGGGADLYRARVNQLINKGWQFSRIDEGRVVFKAEVACASTQAAQIQGVYVVPDRRGEGLATRGMAAVVELVRRNIAPVASLYVNDYNEAARTAYERVGFRETERFMTVMF